MNLYLIDESLAGAPLSQQQPFLLAATAATISSISQTRWLVC